MSNNVWGEFLGHSRSRLIARLHRHGIAYDAAEDALQEAIILLLPQLGTLGAERLSNAQDPRLLSWLTTTACRMEHDQQTRAHSASLLPLDENSTRFAANQDIQDTAVLGVLVEQAWQRLAATDRQMLRRTAEGYSCKDIALHCELSEESIKKRLQRARNRFARHLTDAGLGDMLDTPRLRQRQRNV